MSGDPTSDFSAPDGIEPLVGWRMWNVESLDLRSGGQVQPDVHLRSLNGGEVWRPGRPMEASCSADDLRLFKRHCVAPESSCSCGVHAFREFDSLLPMWLFPGPQGVLGEVSIWGRIIVHEHGYRAQYAYPRRLWVDNDVDGELSCALAAYGVPVSNTQDPWVRRSIDEGLDQMDPELKEAIAFFREMDAWPQCSVCGNIVPPPASICFQCDPRGAHEELKRIEREKRRQKWEWLDAPDDLANLPPRFGSEIHRAKLATLGLVSVMVGALAGLLAHPLQLP